MSERVIIIHSLEQAVTALKVARELKPGERFSYVFDLGDNWHHRCAVLDEKADPLGELGIVPDRPLSSWGWGWIPDQYGRETLDE